MVFFNDAAAVAGSGKMAENICYDSTPFQAERRPPLDLSAASIEMQATIWNVAYATIGLRYNEEEGYVYETISDATAIHITK